MKHVFFWDLHFVGRESASSVTDWREVELLPNLCDYIRVIANGPFNDYFVEFDYLRL